MQLEKHQDLRSCTVGLSGFDSRRWYAFNMDINVTGVDVQTFSIQTVEFEGAVAFLFFFCVTWLALVVAMISLSLNFYRFRQIPPLSPYIADTR